MVDNGDSILNTIKPMVGVEVDDKNFDMVLIPFINGALSILTQLGVGPTTGFRIADETKKWSELLGDREDLDLVATAIYIRVRLLFDPPQNAFLMTALKEELQETEWRIEAFHNPLPVVEPTPDTCDCDCDCDYGT